MGLDSVSRVAAGPTAEKINPNFRVKGFGSSANGGGENNAEDRKRNPGKSKIGER
jgi:hypothetical protein